MGENERTNDDERSRYGATNNSAANGADREVQMLMKQTGCSYSQVLALMHRYGSDRASIERAASRLRPPT